MIFSRAPPTVETLAFRIVRCLPSPPAPPAPHHHYATGDRVKYTYVYCIHPTDQKFSKRREIRKLADDGLCFARDQPVKARNIYMCTHMKKRRSCASATRQPRASSLSRSDQVYVYAYRTGEKNKKARNNLSPPPPPLLLLLQSEV